MLISQRIVHGNNYPGPGSHYSGYNQQSQQYPTGQYPNPQEPIPQQGSMNDPNYLPSAYDPSAYGNPTARADLPPGMPPSQSMQQPFEETAEVSGASSLFTPQKTGPTKQLFGSDLSQIDKDYIFEGKRLLSTCLNMLILIITL